jgi:pimeloyl-ACP methyl ester carboxylesterase
MGALVLLLASCGTGGPGADPDGAAGVIWTACAERLQCANVAVPLDWSRPDGATITLAVARYPAATRSARLGSLFFNPGGPGVSGVEVLSQRYEDLAAVGSGRFDIVSWDPRGAGPSTAIPCFADDRRKRCFTPAGRCLPTGQANESSVSARRPSLTSAAR